MDCTFLEKPMKKPSQKVKVVKNNAILFPSIPKPTWPKTPNLPQTKSGPKTPSKLPLQSLLNRNKADNRLIIWLRKTWPHRNEHFFLL